jgi:biopolymer transport protein ExbD
LLAFLRARAGADPELILSGGPNTPYRCIGHAIELAYRAGFTRVGFLSEPAPDKRR